MSEIINAPARRSQRQAEENNPALDLSLVNDLRDQEPQHEAPKEQTQAGNAEPWTFLCYLNRQTCELRVEINPDELKTWEFGIAITDMVKQYFEQMKRNAQMAMMQQVAQQAQRDAMLAEQMRHGALPGRRR